MFRNTLLTRSFLLLICLFVNAYCFSENWKGVGEPTNSPLSLHASENNKKIVLKYDGEEIFNADLPIQATIKNEIKGKEFIEQHISLEFRGKVSFNALVRGSDQALAAETRGDAHKKFPLIRTSYGLSNSLRNNAIYERKLDWMLEMPEGTRIQSKRNMDGTSTFELKFTGERITLIFRPKYYQNHKHLTYYQPWTYDVCKESITGWSSWWAYFRNFKEAEMDKLLQVWEDKKLSAYGYKFIQIDDVFQGEFDSQRKQCAPPNDYVGGRPTTWLDWKKDLFPGGINHYVQSVKKAGFSPAIWMGCFFTDVETAEQHPSWFMKNKEGKPAVTPWAGYVMDATNPVVDETLIRPTFRGLKNAGIEYVKIDQLRHFLYDGLHNHMEWSRQKGIKPADVFRSYLRIAREEMGKNAFILACWGVMPEAIGLVDACRIGGDGYGPATMQQYNSWNGIVWRNDPDHCDIFPEKKGLGTGNITNVKTIRSVKAETIIRPALASIAGAMLLVSDKPDVYEDSLNLVGLKRVSPVLFSVPGQLYDFDPTKTDWLKTHQINEIRSGKDPSPIDAEQFGTICPFWLNEFNTGFDQWVVLHRLNWLEKVPKDLPPTTIQFADLGLDPSKEYLVFEFWKSKMLGKYKGCFDLSALESNGIESLAIREKLDRPQLLSTNRHLSQGAAEIEKMVWDNNILTGRSRVISNDEYILTFYIPSEYTFKKASLLNNKEITAKQNGNILEIKYTPEQTESIEWKLEFN